MPPERVARDVEPGSGLTSAQADTVTIDYVIAFCSLAYAFDCFSGGMTLKQALAQRAFSTRGPNNTGVSLTYMFTALLKTFFGWRAAYRTPKRRRLGEVTRHSAASSVPPCGGTAERIIMQGFEFVCPTKIVCGAHALDKLPGELESRGVTHPLVMTDAGLVKLGVAAKLTDVLDAAGVAYEMFDQVPPDSSMDVVNEVARLYTERGCDGFVAIGGGSVIDTTKGAAASLACEGVDFATLQGSEILKADLPPLIAVPTTAGTGSEVTLVAVVADTHKHAKLSFTSYKLVPHAAILDPALTSSLPPKLTATTGMDALTHAVEAYTSIQKNPVSDAFAVKAIELIAENLPVACRDGANVDARTSLALGSLLAGAAFSTPWWASSTRSATRWAACATSRTARP